MDDEADSNIARLIEGRTEKKKRQYSFYIDENLYKQFMKVCKHKDISGSRVVAAYMKDFIDKYG